MDPMLQRFGDVTIQRLEKPREPKMGPQSDSGALEKTREPEPELEPNPPTSSEEESDEEAEHLPIHLKKSLPSSEVTVKRFKFDKSGDITLEKKISNSNSEKISQEINDELNVNNFSDTEMSDYESETDIESDGELSEIGHSVMGPGAMVPGVMGPGVMGPGMMGPRMMGPRVMGPSMMRPSVMGPTVMGPTVMGASMAGPNVMRPSLTGPSIGAAGSTVTSDVSVKEIPKPQLPPMQPFKEDMIKDEVEEDDEEDEEEETENSEASFLEKLVEEPFMDPTLNSSKPAAESAPPTDNEDYDYDIKEKLKEMGEISFETVKKGEKPKKTEVTIENEVSVTRKGGILDEETTERLKASGVNMRRNIREVMDDTKLDEATLAAQRLEMERLRRVQEQQRLIRELQRQAAQERMQHKVLSMLQGNSMPKPGTSGTRIGNTVLVKLPNGQTTPMTKLPKRPFELVRVQKGGAMGAPQNTRSLLTSKKPGANLTPSVSIAPVNKKAMPTIPKPYSDSDSETDERRLVMRHPHKRRSKDAPSTATTIDLSSDDDCIVVSESEGEPGTDEPEEDPSNSGMHTNDEFNQPDEQGRVLVNVGHPENEPDIFVAPQIARIIKPHQIGGVRFLYDNVVESTTRFESSAGFGCILAHSMGLGKTLQVVCFSEIFLRHTPAKTILCIMPINTLQNWLAEYNMWLPTEDAASNSSLIVHGEIRPRNFNLHVLNDSHKTLVARAKVIHEWRTKGGVLLIGYEMFRLLSMKKHPKSRKKNPNLKLQEDDRTKLLFDEVHQALVEPGPDLVICDEGHRIKNSHASISHALKQMKTRRRVVLTGYPLQNNLMEYWCMVDFVRPNYLGTKTEFCNMFERPILNGQCIDSTDADIKLMRYRAHVLHSLLVGFVQRRSHTVLQMTLPQKEEYVLLVRMTEFQRKLYDTFMNLHIRPLQNPNPLKAFAINCKIWNHPDVLYNFLKKRAGGDAVDIDLEEVATVGSTVPNETPAAGSKRKTPAKPRKAPAKRKNEGKPAASITPYNSTGDPTPTDQNNPPQSQPPVSVAGPFTNMSQSLQPISSECKDLPPSAFCQNSDGSFHNESFAQNPTFFDFEQTNSQFPPSYTEKNFGDNYIDNCQSQPNSSTDFSSAMSPSGLSFNFTTQTSTSQQNSNFNRGITPVESISTPPPASSSSNLLELTPSKGQNTTSFTNTLANQSQQNPDSQMNDCQFTQNQNNSNFNQNTPLPTFENFNQPNFQNYSQNYWGQQTENYNQQNDYFDTCGQPYNPNFTSNTTNNSWIKKEENITNNSWIKKEESASNSSWIKKEDKPFMENMVISPSVKSETSNDSKPKINIISDIKLPPVFTSLEKKEKKKITILSDIKLELKKEEVDEKPEMKLEPPTPPREETKVEETEKVEEKTPEKTPDKAPFESPLSKLALKDTKEDGTIPYDWAIELLKDYIPGHIENSAKMKILFCIIRESIVLGDRLLVFSQSLITLDLIEQFLQMNLIPGDSVKWARNVSYYRLDGSTSALEREKLINEFNSNPKIHLFLVSTRAGSLGINLVGANRVVVLDASWNPCHDTQAVCRVYRYGQRKPCFVYRLVVDDCMEKKIYDRQINKQGMSDRIVDECNPDAHLTIKEVSSLCFDDYKAEGEETDWSHTKDNYIDVVLQKVLDLHGRTLNKEPFQHESLLVDRKEKQLSQLEKRLAKKGYEREKQAARQPTYNMAAGARGHRPVASVRPMQQGERPSRWIPAEHWQRQGMTAQEMTLPLDVVIPTNQPEKGNIVLKAGQKVLVLKSPKGVYMQLESGKVVAIKTAIKVKGKAEDNHDPTRMIKPPGIPPSMKVPPSIPGIQKQRMVRPFAPGMAKMNVRSIRQNVPNLVSHIKNVSKKVQMTKGKPYQIGSEIAKAVSQKETESQMMMPGSSGASSDEEHSIHEEKPHTPLPPVIPSSPMVPSSPEEERFVENKEINKRISQLKKQISIQRVPATAAKQQPSQKQAASASTLEQLEHTTSSVMNDAGLPFQDTLDSITNNYKDDNLEDEESLPSSTEPKRTESQAGSEVSDQSDDVTYVSEHNVQQPQQSQQQYPQQNTLQQNEQPKTENPPNQEYNYSYYGYQPYHAPHPPPPQGYAYPPHQPPPYDMLGGYPPQHQQPPPQYNYGYQGYPPHPPPQPHYPPPPPQPGYDYNAPPPPQPIYSGYHAPYPPQQYPPPPPPQGMYPPPPAPTTAPPPPFPEYQYPPINTAPPQTQSYYPNP